MFAHTLRTMLKLLAACPWLLAIAATTGAEGPAAPPEGGRRPVWPIGPPSGDRGRLLLRRLGGQERALAGRPGVDRTPVRPRTSPSG